MSVATVETWKPVPEWEGWYEVSDIGRVRSVDRVVTYADGRRARYKGRVLAVMTRPWPGGRARRVVGLHRAGEHKTYFVYTLVIAAFVGPRPEGYDICHNNGDSADDRIGNLRYDTTSENIRDAVRHGTHGRTSRTHCPQGHPLVAPNLKPDPTGQGHRRCLACSRAHANAHHAKRTNRPHDFPGWADDHFARIMEASRDHAGLSA